MYRYLAAVVVFLIGIVIGCIVHSGFEKSIDDIGWADAKHVYRKEAERGNADSQYWLGLYILEGKGEPPNPQEAFEWIQKSADKGNIKALIKLAWMYENGIGVAQNDAMALELYKKAAETAKTNLEQKG